MRYHHDLSGALFSASLWPGLGQFAQGRLLVGVGFLVWTTLGLIGAAWLLTQGRSPVPAVIEVALVALWSIIDAYWRPIAKREQAL